MMFAKEKAEELINKFWLCTNGSYKMVYKHAVKCALILVNEIIDSNFGENYDHKYWCAVKRYLEEKL